MYKHINVLNLAGITVVGQEEMEEEEQDSAASEEEEEEEHSSVWSRRKALSKMLPGREKQVHMLLELFGEVN